MEMASYGAKIRHVFCQPRPQGLPRGGARAEKDPGKINTARKRLRMRGAKKKMARNLNAKL